MPREAPAPVNKSCTECDYRDNTCDKSCPRCGVALLTERQVRGFAPISLLGGSATLLIGIVGYFKVTKWYAERAVFDADDEMKLYLALGVFAAFGVCGVLTLVCALLELESGRAYGRLQWRLIKGSMAVVFAIELFIAFFYWQ